MRAMRTASLALLLLSLALWMGAQASAVQAGVSAQIPTGSVPTVTGTLPGAVVVILDNEQNGARLRAGPNTADFPEVGWVVAGTELPALGQTAKGFWIQVAYAGAPGGVAWILRDLVELRGDVPVVDSPPTPTPRVTVTLDPTLAAQFQVQILPTRLPTYTPPPPLAIPTFPPEAPPSGAGPVPMGLVIIGMAVIGIFGTLISFLRGR